jgi:hypothetical protein
MIPISEDILAYGTVMFSRVTWCSAIEENILDVLRRVTISKIEQRQSNGVMHDALQSANNSSLAGLSFPNSLKEYWINREIYV